MQLLNTYAYLISFDVYKKSNFYLILFTECIFSFVTIYHKLRGLKQHNFINLAVLWEVWHGSRRAKIKVWAGSYTFVQVLGENPFPWFLASVGLPHFSVYKIGSSRSEWVLFIWHHSNFVLFLSCTFKGTLWLHDWAYPTNPGKVFYHKVTWLSTWIPFATLIPLCHVT